MDTDGMALHVVRVAYSVAEVAEQLGISQRKLRQELREGRIGFVRVGRRVLITGSQLKEFLDCGAVASFDASVEARTILGSGKAMVRKHLRARN